MRRSTGRAASVHAAQSRLSEVRSSADDGAVRTRAHSPAVRWSVDVRMIERERVLRGWTRGELARAAHVDEKTLRDMLSRRRRPKFGTVQAVCTALGLTLPNVIVFARED
jgi:DNA-binding Xre family transcriptional regulator